MSLTVGSQPLLGPLLGLTSWTLVMEIWMYSLRIPAIYKYKVNPDPNKIKQEVATKIPPELEYPAQNFTHLMEQPTQFYATLLALNALGVNDKFTVRVAWTYVALRIIHSFVQATTNKIMTRFRIFATSSMVLAGLTAKLGMVIYNGS